MTRAINELHEALKEDRAGFIKGLIAAGYVDIVVYGRSGDDNELVRLTAGIYSDLWDTFNREAFESWTYRFA